MEKEEKIDVKLKDGHLNPKLFKAIFTVDFLNFLNEINEKEDVADGSMFFLSCPTGVN